MNNENIIGCAIGRASENWIDVNLFSHQITFTKAGKFNFNNPNYILEGKILSSFHFDVIVSLDVWAKLYDKLNNKGFKDANDVFEKQD